MGGFLSFVKKEALHIVRDPRTMLIVLLMPVVQVLLFGFAMNTEVTDIEVAVVAPHPTEAVRQAVERIAANPYFTFRGCIAATEIDRTLRRGDADAVVVFAEDYDRRTEALKQGLAAEPAVQLVFDASNTNTASAGAGYLTSVLLSGAPGVSAAGTRLLFNPQMKSSYNFVPGIMGMIFILICAMMTSVSIVREKETGTMEVLLVSPVRPLKVVLAKMIPYWVIGTAVLGAAMLLAWIVYGLAPAGSIGAIFLAAGLFVLTMSGLGVAIANRSETMQQTMFVMFFFVMIFILMSGLITPVESMPAWAQWITRLLPPRYFVEIMRAVYLKGSLIGDLWSDYVLLAVFAAAFNTLAAATYRKRT